MCKQTCVNQAGMGMRECEFKQSSIECERPARSMDGRQDSMCTDVCTDNMSLRHASVGADCCQMCAELRNGCWKRLLIRETPGCYVDYRFALLPRIAFSHASLDPFHVLGLVCHNDQSTM